MVLEVWGVPCSFFWRQEGRKVKFEERARWVWTGIAVGGGGVMGGFFIGL